MRIISKFHDYYDPVMQYGIDKEYVYERNCQEIVLNNRHFFSRRGPIEMTRERRKVEKFRDIFQKKLSIFYGWNDKKRESTQFLGTESYGFILFCGEIHPFVQIAIRENMNSFNYYVFSKEEIHKKLTHYDEKVMHSYISQESIEFNEKGLLSKRKKFPMIYESFFTHPVSKQYNELVDFHIKYQSPIILLEYMRSEIKLLIDPKLLNYEFYRAYDSFSAFQKIYSFMSGVLGNKEKETSNIDDDDLKEMKGFNNWSFKKEPTKKRR